MSTIRLSILIASIDSRLDERQRLLNVLNRQKTDAVEIIVLSDSGEENGGLNIGEKRQSLLEMASGDYVCFIDDDDLVSDDYVPKILAASDGNPDCISLDQLIFFKNGEIRHRKYTLECKEPYSSGGGFDMFFITHLTPVKREIALAGGFPPISREEDLEYSRKISGMLMTEGKTTGILYHHLLGFEAPTMVRRLPGKNQV